MSKLTEESETRAGDLVLEGEGDSRRRRSQVVCIIIKKTKQNKKREKDSKYKITGTIKKKTE